MRRFLHDRQRRLEERLAASSAALRAYLALDPTMGEHVLSFLDRTAGEYRTMGDPDAENEILALEAQLAAARGGLNPITLQQVTRHRRENERAIGLQALLASAARLRTDLSGTRQQLDEAQERLLPMVSVGLQKGLLSPSPTGQYQQAELEAAWQSLVDDPGLRASAQQLAMDVTVADILLLLADLLAALHSAPGGRRAAHPDDGDGKTVGDKREEEHVPAH